MLNRKEPPEVLTRSESQLIRHGIYSIESKTSRPFPHETNPWLFKSGNIASWICWGCYLLVEASFIHSLDAETGIIKTCLWTTWLAECCLYFVDFNWAFDAFTTVLRPQVQSRRPHYKLVGNIAPHVDVFVTCCGEPIEIIMNTVKAAATQDYPGNSFSVVVLDDGHDDELRDAVEVLNSSGRALAQVYYRSRTLKKNTRSFFKAGNLNFGIQETKNLKDGEFLASLDADMIVSRNWLRSLVPHLLLDAKLGMTTSPQNYYNVPRGDPLAQQAEFTIWNTIFEPIHDHVGEAMCMGTGFIVRRAALEQIGGWPLTDTGEDYMCSTKLMEKGWKIAYIRENFQHGITPESFQCRVKQRLRWIDAAFEVHKSNKWYLSNNLGDGVTLLNKVCSLIFALRDLAAISTVCSLLVLPLTLVVCSSNGPILIPWAGHYNLLNIILITAYVTGKLCDWMVYRHAGLLHLSNLQSMEIWAAPYCATGCISHLIGSMLDTKPKFFVTGSFKCLIDERSHQHRAALVKRLTTFGIPIYIAYVAISAAIVTICSRIFLMTNNSTLASSSSLTPSVAAILPGHIILLARCGWKMAVPAWYMVFPPTVPEWHTFLIADEYGVLRPRRPFPSYVTPDQQGGVEMIGSTKVWRDIIEMTVLAYLFLGK